MSYRTTKEIKGTLETNNYIVILAGVPDVAWDEKLRKEIFEITWRDKGWIG
jgi:hypothetical protein